MKKFFKAFPEKYPKLWEFIKFVFTAFSTTILYYIVFWIGQATLVEPLKDVEVHSSILKFLGYDENLGLAISYLLASFLSYAASYIMNRKVTFKSNSNVLVSTILFALMVVVTTAFTAWFGTFATNWAQAQGGFWASGFVSSLLIPTVAMLIPFVWTFPFQKYVIYRNKKPVEGEEVQEAETAKEAEEVKAAEDTKAVEDTKETEEVQEAAEVKVAEEAQEEEQAAQKDSE